jgi:hypothetical protein
MRISLSAVLLGSRSVNSGAAQPDARPSKPARTAGLTMAYPWRGKPRRWRGSNSDPIVGG